VSGSGGVSFDIGGVTATTEGTRFDNPFAGPIGDAFPGLEAGHDLPAEELPAVSGPATTAGPPIPATGAPFAGDDPLAGSLGGAYAAPGFGGEAAPPASTLEELAGSEAVGFEPALGPTSRRLPGRRGGTALAIGVLGLLGVLAVAGADALRLRRSARSFP